MARSKKKKAGLPKALWLVTFSDLVTLLLTFFVLLLSMSSMDTSVIKEISSVFSDKIAFMSRKSSGKIENRFEVVKEMIDKPWEVLEKKDRIKDLLFPDMVLPPDINRSTLQENLDILVRPEGVALVLSDNLLFPTGKTELPEQGQELLKQIASLIRIWPAPVNISGYTDNVPSFGRGNIKISAQRAMAVLDYFLNNKQMQGQRFSVSAYGPNFPIADNDTPQGRARNRRVEVLFKNMPHSYM